MDVDDVWNYDSCELAHSDEHQRVAGVVGVRIAIHVQACLAPSACDWREHAHSKACR